MLCEDLTDLKRDSRKKQNEMKLSRIENLDWIERSIAGLTPAAVLFLVSQ